MTWLFNEIIYRPIFNLLVGIYNVIPGHDFGIAIIVLTVAMRIVFLPLSIKANRAQRLLARIQPEIKALQEKFKNDKAAQAQAVMALYKERKINPAGGCLPLLIQLPILLALYRALANGLNPDSLKILYTFVTNPGTINQVSLGFFSLAGNSHVLAIISGILQFIQAKLMAGRTPKPVPGAKSASVLDPAMLNKQMLYFLPVMIVVIGWNLPAGLVLYWAVTTLVGVFEQLYVNRLVDKEFGKA